MKSIVVVIALGLFAGMAFGGEVLVQRMQGEVQVRQGVTEEWHTVAPGVTLKPNDTMKTGKKSSALVVARFDGKPEKRILLPADALVDISDIRDLSQEELMLKLTMAKVRASSYEWKIKEMEIPDAAVVHGQDKETGRALAENRAETGVWLWNGTCALFTNGFTATGILRALEVFRLYPALGAVPGNRLLLAGALEKAELHGEALTEYGAIAQMEGLTDAQRSVVHARMEALRK